MGEKYINQTKIFAVEYWKSVIVIITIIILLCSERLAFAFQSDYNMFYDVSTIRRMNISY